MSNTNITEVHPTAVLHPSVVLGEGVYIGPYCIIGEDVKINDGTRLESNVFIDKNTTIGKNCKIWPFAAIGAAPQDYRFNDEKSFVVVGDNNMIREYVTIHRASGEGNSTVVGDNNLLMAYCHIAHNCHFGNGITMANYVGVCGHVHIEDRVVLGGLVGIHQNVCIGKMAMIGGCSKVVQDIPPFIVADGRPTKIHDLNVIGLRRNGVTSKSRSDLRQAYKLLYRSKLNMSQAITAVENDLESSEEVEYLLNFIRNIRFGKNGRQNEHK